MKRIIKVMLIGFSLIIMGCSLAVSPDVAVKPVPQYKFYQEQEGLRIAVDPFYEKERLQNSFSGDLLSFGILPILIVIENHNPKSGYLLDRKFFSIAMEASQQTSDKDLAVPMPQKEIDTLKYTGLGIVGVSSIIGPPIMLIPGMAVMGYAAKKEIDIKEINENLSRKAFIDRTVYPGESHSGFVYFPVRDREASQNIAAVLVKAKDIPSDKELTFVFQIKN